MIINSKLRLLLFISLIFPAAIFSQADNFDLQAYKNFLSSHQGLSANQLSSLYPAGIFKDNLNLKISSAFYLDSIKSKYQLTEDEISLIEKNGFMVTERIQSRDFKTSFSHIFYYDLPVFVSTDAVLDAVHRSYDKMLKDVELEVLIPKLTEFLRKLHEQMPALSSEYSFDPRMDVMLKDLDVYLTVARKLLGESITPYYSWNNSSVSEMLKYVEAAGPAEIKMFSDTKRWVDFSQFTPRGHYTDELQPKLEKYFKAMMWLGRIELYLLAPRALQPKPSEADLERQTVVAELISEAVQKSNTFQTYNDINGIIQFFVGEQDNVTLPNILALTQGLNIKKASELLNGSTLKAFQSKLKTEAFAYQRILSQIIMTDGNQPDSLMPASAFMLFGQRFIVDSYVLGQVVFDRIFYNQEYILRMLPSTRDILFALGNNAAAQLLKNELDSYHYGQNLSALRYLIDSYGGDFWNQTIYNMWLNSLRKLNPPEDRSGLPLFMQTAAFWQEKMNTQLSSWAQLRHDNLLYAKQSYSGGMIICSYPYSYVEPFPDFYKQLKTFAGKAKDYFTKFTSGYKVGPLVDYFAHLSAVSDTLYGITVKELSGLSFNEKERAFLKNMLSYHSQGCGGPAVYNGWYPRLIYTSSIPSTERDYVVADVHTAPTDEKGNMVGWVLHAGTGPVDMGVFVVPAESKRLMAFVGPVMSYYEHVSTNFKRLTDQEWETSYAQAPSIRPDLVNIYLADKTGRTKPSGQSLITSVNDIDGPVAPDIIVLSSNYPNPFNSSTVIRYTIPYKLSLARTKLVIYNIQGEVIKELVDEILPSGTYLSRWDGTNMAGNTVTSGIYLYKLTVGSHYSTGKMSLVK